MATFIVAPSDRGFLRLKSVHDQSAYIAVGKGKLKPGQGTCREPLNSTPMGVHSISPAYLHVRPMGRTCR